MCGRINGYPRKDETCGVMLVRGLAEKRPRNGATGLAITDRLLIEAAPHIEASVYRLYAGFHPCHTEA